MADLLRYLVPSSRSCNTHPSVDRKEKTIAANSPPVASSSPLMEFSTSFSAPSPQPCDAVDSMDIGTDATIPTFADLPVYGIDEYLKTHAPASESNSSSTNNKKQSRPAVSAIAQPQQIGTPKTSHHTIAFNHLCQERGVQPSFDIEEKGTQQFFIRLSFEDQELEELGPFQSKKEAKEAASEKGIAVLKDLPVRDMLKPGRGVDENWVGKLVEYYMTTFPSAGPVYIDYAVGTQYSCECLLPEKRPLEPFGGQYSPTFPNKRAAKANAAREAVEWLKANGHLGENYRAKKKQKIVNGGITVHGEREEGKTWAQRVNDLCPHLSVSHPSYRLTSDPNANSMYSGAAYFPNDPFLFTLNAFNKIDQSLASQGGPIGEIRNVFGKKNAKEECAKAVWEFLMGVIRERKGDLGDVGKSEDLAGLQLAKDLAREEGNKGKGIDLGMR